MDNDPHLEARRNRYRVRLARLAAGSALTAASVTSLTGFTTGVPAPATTVQPGRTIADATADAEADAQERNHGDERISGVRAELEGAVAMGMVTDDQANRFLTQLEERIARGL